MHTMYFRSKPPVHPCAYPVVTLVIVKLELLFNITNAALTKLFSETEIIYVNGVDLLGILSPNWCM